MTCLPDWVVTVLIAAAVARGVLRDYLEWRRDGGRPEGP